MRKFKEDIFEVGAIHWDARLFDRLIPLPEGTSYNSYLIKGSEKTALLDTVDPGQIQVLLDNLMQCKVEKIDYIISHHGEQDHSGSLNEILLLHPEARIVTDPMCKKMLIDLHHIEEDKFVTVEDGQTLSLGNKTLQFIYLPWVHWPETFGTYLQEDKILFSCDFFGAHLATSNLFVDDEADVYTSAKRYYAEIMMPFRKKINENLEKISKLPIDFIAPSHGPVHKRPEFIINAYKDWASDSVKNEVVVAYVSMHGSTAKMIEHFVGALIDRGIKVRQFELSTVDIGRLAMALVDAATIVIGTPTVLAGPHPCAIYAAYLANILKPKTKVAAIIGSYGWGGKTVDLLKSNMSNLKAEILEPLIIKGLPKDSDFESLDKLADRILEKHRELNIIN